LRTPWQSWLEVNLYMKIVWLLRRAVTVAVALPLLFVVMMLSAGIAGAAAFTVTYALGSVFSPSLVWDLAVATVAASWAGLYGAVPPARFMLRLFPWRADERYRWKVLVVVVLVGAMVLAVAALFVFAPSPRLGKFGGPQATVIGLVVAVVQVIVMLQVYASLLSSLAGHRIVYMRRFHGFSDRVVYRFLLAALPRGARVIALVPSHGGARDLDRFASASPGCAGSSRWRQSRVCWLAPTTNGKLTCAACSRAQTASSSTAAPILRRWPSSTA